MRISDWSSDVCSSDLAGPIGCSAARSARTATIDGNAGAPLEADRLDGGDLGGERTGARPGERSAAVLGRRLTHPNQRFASQTVSDERDTVAMSFARPVFPERSEEHTSELQSLMRISYAVFCLKNNTSCLDHTKCTKIRTDTQ